jgi:hypothetical protein
VRVQHDLAVDGEGLEHDVEAFAVLMHERGADIEPKVILTFALDAFGRSAVDWP